MTTRCLRITFLFFLFGLPVFLQAQTARLSWTGGEYASRYEVVIEKEQDDNYTEHVSEFTSERVIRLPLSPGKYRYSVIPYDILDRPGTASDWMYFEVFPPPEPEILVEVFPLPEIEIAMEEPSSSEPEIAIDEPPLPVSEIIVEEPLSPEPEIIVEAHIPAAPELYPEQEDLQILERKPRSFFVNIGAAYIPVFPAYADNSDQEIQFLGGTLRASISFQVIKTLFIGPELAVLMTDYQFTMGLNMRIFKSIYEKNSGFVFRTGAEYVILWDDQELDSPINFVAGISFIWHFIPAFNIEIGFDFTSSMNIPPVGSVRPWLGVGWRF